MVCFFPFLPACPCSRALGAVVGSRRWLLNRATFKLDFGSAPGLGKDRGNGCWGSWEQGQVKKLIKEGRLRDGAGRWRQVGQH